MEGSHHVLLIAIFLTYLIARRPLTKATFKRPSSIIKNLPGMIMEYPFLNLSSAQASLETLTYPASHHTTRSRSHSYAQGDRVPSNASGLTEFRNTSTGVMNNYLPRVPDLNSEADAKLFCEKKEPGLNPWSPSVYYTPSTRDLTAPQHSVPGRTVYNNTDSHISSTIHDVASNGIHYTDVDLQEDNDWQKQLEKAAFGKDLSSQGLAYESIVHTNATPLYGLDYRTFSKPKDFAPDMSNCQGLGPSNVSNPSYGSTSQRLSTNKTNLSDLGPSSIASPARATPTRRKHSGPKHLPGSRRRRRHAPSTSTLQNIIPKLPIRPTSKVSDPHPKRHSDTDPDEHLFRTYTNIRDEEQQQNCNTFGPSHSCEKGGPSTPGEYHINNSPVPEGSEPHTGHCCSEQEVGDPSREATPQPPKVLQTGSKPRRTEKKERKSANPDGTRGLCPGSRRANPKNLYYCIDPTCKASPAQNGSGFREKMDMRRHLLIHILPRIFCKLSRKDGSACVYSTGRLDHLMEWVFLLPVT